MTSTDATQPIVGEGGAAFPNTGNGTWGLHPEVGMSLRNWFAGQALAGMGVWIPPADYGPFNWDSREDVCSLKSRWAYAQADAMLATRAVPAIKPFSTYPEDREKLLNLARKCERSDDASAIELGDLVRAILEDEAVAEGTR